MATRQTADEDVLRRNRARATEMARAAGGAPTRKLLERAAADLSRRLRRAQGLSGPGPDSFTAWQLQATLRQVQEVLRPLTRGMGEVVLDQGRAAAEAAVSGTLRYLRDAERHYTGVARPLPLEEASLLDASVRGAESSVLARVASDPRHPGQPGVLARYGASTIGNFEEVLQRRFVTGAPWAEVRDEVTAASPFLEGAPAAWAERIVRTEVMSANNHASFETIRRANEELGDMLKIISSVFDDRTGSDSYAVHGQVRRPQEAFQSWFGLYQSPPDRPNDRSIVVPHRMSWPLPASLKQRSDSEIVGRWRYEGRKGSPPPRPLMSTVPGF